MHLDHIAVIVSKEENINFYEKLGFKVKNRFVRNYDTVIFMQSGDVTLEMFVDPSHPERLTEPEAMGLRHIAFTVDNFEEFVGKLDTDPVRTDFFGRRFTFCKDPDGQSIEINEMLNN